MFLTQVIFLSCPKIKILKNVISYEYSYLNILHIWDQSGVACILSKYQIKLGHQSVVLRRSNYDPYGIYKFYDNLVEFAEEKDFFELCLARAKNADIIHIHSRSDILLYLRKKLGDNFKVIMHFHGSDLRGIDQKYRSLKLTSIPKAMFKRYTANKIRKRNNLEAIRTADSILVSTPDLLNKIQGVTPILLNNPVDQGHFCKKQGGRFDSNKRYFTFKTEATSDIEWIIKFCKKNGIDNVEIVDRINNPILYAEMPKFLHQYDIYVDVRFVNNTLLENFSKTALESLSCGLEVIDFQMKKWSKLPVDNEPMNAANKVLKIYEEVM